MEKISQTEPECKEKFAMAHRLPERLSLLSKSGKNCSSGSI